jgi:hypothetical protein
MTINLTDRIREIDRAVCEEYWCSGDFKAATDKLSSRASELVLERLPHFGLPVIESFLDNRINYPDGTFVDQRNGQLMGHPLSFPILCIVNLAIYWATIEKCRTAGTLSGGRARRMWSNVLINGDDILFKCSREFYECWIEMTRSVGLVVSLGKNYLSPDCCLINSKLYRRVAGRMEPKGYLNLKLVLGTSLKQGESKSLPTQIGKDLSEMTSICPWARCAIPAAFDRWKDSWKGWFQPNWFLPVHLGGYGVAVRDASDSWFVTREQRIMAARFVHNPDLMLFRVKGGSLAQARGSLMIFRLKPVYSPPEEFDVSGEEDWTARYAYALRASGFGPNEISDRVFFLKLKKASRLKPMSDRGLARKWNLYWTSGPVPPCPPLSLL